jgi:hypothetical protein
VESLSPVLLPAPPSISYRSQKHFLITLLNLELHLIVYFPGSLTCNKTLESVLSIRHPILGDVTCSLLASMKGTLDA